MPHRARRPAVRSALAGLAVLAVATGLLAATAPAAVAAAPPSPPVPVDQPAGSVTADALPTVQIDGVAWNQTVAGDTVYVGGEFTTARPAGAEPGVRTKPRGNFLAYTLSTGALLPFAPKFNKQVYAVAVSPDGRTLYVGGQFTKVTVRGVVSNRYRLAAFDLATGTLRDDFAPVVNYVVKSVVASNTKVWFGGAFGMVGNATRNRLAAVRADNGALLPWNPDADGQVSAMVLTPNGRNVVVGGDFRNVGGTAAYGITAVAVTGEGARVPWQTDQVVRNAGSAAGITSLASDGTSIYGSGYVFGAGGNLEGAFRANARDGSVTWVEDCHGDTYGVFASPGAVYTVSHAHTCQNVGGWPQTNPARYQHALAFTKEVTGTLARETSSNYHDWYGTPAPSLTSWFPELTVGTYTGIGQAAWTVTGNDRYVVLGGEFPTVGGVGQQGLVRFALPAAAPRAIGPELSGGQVTPTLSTPRRGEVQVEFPTNWDRDDLVLTYTVYRDAQPIHTVQQASTFWDRPTLTYTDTTATPGRHGYRVYAVDADGNEVRSDGANVTVR